MKEKGNSPHDKGDAATKFEGNLNLKKERTITDTQSQVNKSQIRK